MKWKIVVNAVVPVVSILVTLVSIYLLLSAQVPGLTDMDERLVQVSDGAYPIQVSFVYGLESGGPYPYETPKTTMVGPGPFEFEVTGLSPGTTYFYRAKLVTRIGWVSVGNEVSFTTLLE